MGTRNLPRSRAHRRRLLLGAHGACRSRVSAVLSRAPLPANATTAEYAAAVVGHHRRGAHCALNLLQDAPVEIALLLGVPCAKY